MTRRGARVPEWDVGARVRWPGEQAWGTIDEIVWAGRGGWRIRVVWDRGAPSWWADELSASARIDVAGPQREEDPAGRS